VDANRQGRRQAGTRVRARRRPRLLAPAAALLALAAVPQASAGLSAEEATRWGTVLLLAALLAGAAWAWRRGLPASAGKREASFWEHVAELRARLLVVAVVFLGVTLATLSLKLEREPPYVAPAVYEPLAAQAFQLLHGHVVPHGVELVVTSPGEAFGAQVMVGFALGAAAGIPVLLAQLAAFARPGMREAERKAVRAALLPAAALFLGGAAFTYQWVLPAMFRALYAFAGGLEARPLLRADDLVSFSGLTMLLFGLAFQTPLVMAALARAGLVRPASYVRAWRWAVLGIVVVAAFATPDGSPVTLALVAGPVLCLYALGIGLSYPAARRAAPASPA
jgi:sec-independent protein translocase protein TatC